jgi:hypothetical protein
MIEVDVTYSHEFHLGVELRHSNGEFLTRFLPEEASQKLAVRVVDNCLEDVPKITPGELFV